ncbi:hypothetical protein Tco_1311825, partial [Tanacetum coccineum]
MVNTRTNSVTPVVTMDALQETMNEIKSALLTLTGKVNYHTLEFKVFQTELATLSNGEGTSGGNNDRNINGRQGNNQIVQYGRMSKIEFPKFNGADEATNSAMKPRYTSAQANYKPNSFGGGYKSTGLLPKPTTTPLALPAPTQTNNGTRYSPGYKCNGQVYSLEVIGESEEQEEDDSEHLVKSNEEDDNVEMCNVVFDNSSTHNFIDIRSAKRLGCKIRPTAPLLVSVANGEEI